MPLSQQSLSGKLLPPTAFQSHSPLFLCPQILLQWSAEWSVVSIPHQPGTIFSLCLPRCFAGFHNLPEGPEWQYEVKWDGYRMQTIEREAAKTNRTKATPMSPQLVTCTETTFCYLAVVLRCRTCVRRAG